MLIGVCRRTSTYGERAAPVGDGPLDVVAQDSGVGGVVGADGAAGVSALGAGGGGVVVFAGAVDFRTAGVFFAAVVLLAVALLVAFFAGAFSAVVAFFADAAFAAFFAGAAFSVVVLVFFAAGAFLAADFVVFLAAALFAGAFSAGLPDVAGVAFFAGLPDAAGAAFSAGLPEVAGVAFLAGLPAAAGAAFSAAAAGTVGAAAAAVDLFPGALGSFGSLIAPETTPLSSLAALNCGTNDRFDFLAPLRAADFFGSTFSKVPKPLITTFSPRATSRVMVSMTASSASAAAFLFPSNRAESASIS
jgi:hypothetical protein